MDVVDNEDVTSAKRFVYLVAKSNDSDMTISKHVKVLVSFLDGIVLLQTDKPIYTPRQTYTMGYTSGIDFVNDYHKVAKPKNESSCCFEMFLKTSWAII